MFIDSVSILVAQAMLINFVIFYPDTSFVLDMDEQIEHLFLSKLGASSCLEQDVC